MKINMNILLTRCSASVFILLHFSPLSFKGTFEQRQRENICGLHLFNRTAGRDKRYNYL